MAAPPVTKQAETGARAAFEEGQRLYLLGKFAEALEQFEDGYRRRSDPSFLYNIGQCHRSLGKPEEAAKAFRAYLEQRPDAPNAEAVRVFIASCEQELRRRATEELVTHQAALPPAEPILSEEAAPLYKKWWLWTAVGGVVVVGAGVGLAVGFSRGSDAAIPTSSGGDYSPSFR